MLPCSVRRTASCQLDPPPLRPPETKLTQDVLRLEQHHSELVVERPDERLPVAGPQHGARDLLVRIQAFLNGAHELEVQFESAPSAADGHSWRHTAAIRPCGRVRSAHSSFPPSRRTP